MQLLPLTLGWSPDHYIPKVLSIYLNTPLRRILYLSVFAVRKCNAEGIKQLYSCIAIKILGSRPH